MDCKCKYFVFSDGFGQPLAIHRLRITTLELVYTLVFLASEDTSPMTLACVLHQPPFFAITSTLILTLYLPSHESHDAIMFSAAELSLGILTGRSEVGM